MVKFVGSELGFYVMVDCRLGFGIGFGVDVLVGDDFDVVVCE